MVEINKQFNDLYKQIDELSDEIPAQLAKKVYLYAHVLQWMGTFHAAAEFDHGKARAERKRTWGEAILSYKGTAKDKEAYAETMIYEARVKESEAFSEIVKWKNAFESTQDIINALKIQQKTLMVELGNGGNQQ